MPSTYAAVRRQLEVWVDSQLATKSMLASHAEVESQAVHACVELPAGTLSTVQGACLSGTGAGLARNIGVLACHVVCGVDRAGELRVVGGCVLAVCVVRPISCLHEVISARQCQRPPSLAWEEGASSQSMS